MEAVKLLDQPAVRHFYLLQKKLGQKRQQQKKAKKKKNGPADGEILLPTQNKQLFQSKVWEML